MGILKKVFWKSLPAQKTQLLHPVKKSNFESSTRLGSIIQTTLENGEFVSLELENNGDPDSRIESSSKAFVHPGAELWKPAESCLQNKSLQISELPQKPDVNQLQLFNKSDQPVFIQSGTVFEGGSQNRVILEPKVIRKGTSTIPVYCIEAGRWSEPKEFTKIRRLPDLLSCKFLNTQGDNLTRQIKYWELILESLSLTKNENQKMNAISMYDDIESSKVIEGNVQNARGYFIPDSQTGISIFRLTPGADHFKESISQWSRESKWRSMFRKFAPGARLYFRIFDEKKSLAVKCHPDGKPYKTIRGKFDLFYYTQKDLQNCYTPPVQSIPLETAISFENAHQKLSTADFTKILNECPVKIARAGSNLVSLEYQHSELPLVGNGLLHEGRLACLDALYYQSEASIKDS